MKEKREFCCSKNFWDYFAPLEPELKKSFVRSKLPKIPDSRERHILTKKYIEGLTYKEIGKEMGISPERVRQLLHRGLSWCAGLHYDKHWQKLMEAELQTINPWLD